MTYNGWTNYETWNVKLWIDNEEGTYNYCRDMARGFYVNSEADDFWGVTENALFDFRDFLEKWIEGGIPEIPNSLYLDILLANLKEVDYMEIAKSIFEELGFTKN